VPHGINDSNHGPILSLLSLPRGTVRFLPPGLPPGPAGTVYRLVVVEDIIAEVGAKVNDLFIGPAGLHQGLEKPSGMDVLTGQLFGVPLDTDGEWMALGFHGFDDPV
jgi:hypothetical protein